MSSLSNDLRNVIAQRVRSATSEEILVLARSICVEEENARVRGEQVSVTSIDVQAPVRFALQGEDDMVLDHSTGLIWSRGNVGEGRLDWADAKEACEELDLGGFKDWRLPTIQELLSIVDYEHSNPAIDSEFFAAESSWYWSSTRYARSPGDCAWGVGFNDGGSYWYDRSDGGFVRAVRAGQ